MFQFHGPLYELDYNSISTRMIALEQLFSWLRHSGEIGGVCTPLLYLSSLVGLYSSSSMLKHHLKTRGGRLFKLFSSNGALLHRSGHFSAAFGTTLDPGG